MSGSSNLANILSITGVPPETLFTTDYRYKLVSKGSIEHFEQQYGAGFPNRLLWNRHAMAPQFLQPLPIDGLNGDLESLLIGQLPVGVAVRALPRQEPVSWGTRAACILECLCISSALMTRSGTFFSTLMRSCSTAMIPVCAEEICPAPVEFEVAAHTFGPTLGRGTITHSKCCGPSSVSINMNGRPEPLTATVVRSCASCQPQVHMTWDHNPTESLHNVELFPALCCLCCPSSYVGHLAYDASEFDPSSSAAPTSGARLIRFANVARTYTSGCSRCPCCLICCPFCSPESNCNCNCNSNAPCKTCCSREQFRRTTTSRNFFKNSKDAQAAILSSYGFALFTQEETGDQNPGAVSGSFVNAVGNWRLGYYESICSASRVLPLSEPGSNLFPNGPQAPATAFDLRLRGTSDQRVVTDKDVTLALGFVLMKLYGLYLFVDRGLLPNQAANFTLGQDVARASERDFARVTTVTMQ